MPEAPIPGVRLLRSTAGCVLVAAGVAALSGAAPPPHPPGSPTSASSPVSAPSPASGPELPPGDPDAPVAEAAARGDAAEVRRLVESGADVNAALGDGSTALHWTARSGDAATSALLLDHGARPDATTRLGSYTPLHMAGELGREEVVRLLLDRGADAGAWTATGVTALHLAASAGDAGTLAALLDTGLEIDLPDRKGHRTPLLFATAAGRMDAVRLLLDRGAGPDLATRVVDFARRGEVDDSLQSARTERVREERRARLREAGLLDEEDEASELVVDPDDPDIQVVETKEAGRSQDGGDEDEAAEEEDDGTPPLVPLGYDDLVGRQGGMSPLHIAARDGRGEIADLLLAAGAELDGRSGGDGSTPLLVALINGQYDLALDFLDRGADPNLASEDGVAPLYAVVANRWAPKSLYPQPTAFKQQVATYLDVMERLLEAGADPDARVRTHIWYSSFNFDLLGVDFSGATAFWRAAYATDVPAMRLLVAWGADSAIPTVVTPTRRRRSDDDEPDPSGLPPAEPGDPAVYPIHAASGVGYGVSRAGNAHRHAPGGWLPAVRYLVEELGADVNRRDKDGFSPLHHAASRGDNELIRYLVDQGADVTFVSRRGQTTVDMANGPQQRVQPFPETIELLEGLGAVNNHNCMSC